MDFLQGVSVERLFVIGAFFLVGMPFTTLAAKFLMDLGSGKVK